MIFIQIYGITVVVTAVLQLGVALRAKAYKDVYPHTYRAVTNPSLTLTPLVNLVSIFTSFLLLVIPHSIMVESMRQMEEENYD